LTQVAIVRTNFVVYDTRLVKIVRSLNKRYSTLVLGWNREGRMLYDMEGMKAGIAGESLGSSRFILKILNVKAPFGKSSLASYIPMLLYFPLFWVWTLLNLVMFRPSVVHACDLDSVLPCYVYKKIFGKKIVLDVFDRYAMTFIPRRFGILFSLINSIEEFFAKESDALITVGERVLETFRERPKYCTIISNFPDDYYGHKEENLAKGVFTILYSGPIMKGRSLEEISQLVKSLENTEFWIHGQIVHKKLFDKITSLPNVKYRGLLTNCDEYYKSIVQADAIVAIYTPATPSHYITMHNKTFEAMMCGVPIITNLSRELISNVGFGIIVEYKDLEGIKRALVNLRDNLELRQRLGRAGRNAFLEKYNWKGLEKELYKAHDSLLIGSGITANTRSKKSIVPYLIRTIHYKINSSMRISSYHLRGLFR
jgi:glycosyltransferase involved in cell wall biosynthesis